jgi:co-chaperonin GroES (HSP10)
VKMLTDFVLVTDIAKQEQTSSGIILTSSVSTGAQPAMVLATGPDATPGIEEGCSVHLDWSKGMAVDVKGKKCAIIKSEYISAIL